VVLAAVKPGNRVRGVLETRQDFLIVNDFAGEREFGEARRGGLELRDMIENYEPQPVQASCQYLPFKA